MKPRLTIDILSQILQQRGICVRFNLISNSINITGYSDGESPEHILSTLPSILHSDLGDIYTGASRNTIEDYLLVIATRNKFNPVTDLLDQTQWDDVDRLNSLYEIMGIDNDELSKTLLLKFLWQGLSLLHNDGTCGSGGMLTICGPQGCGKTQFARWLSITGKAEFYLESGQISTFDKDDKRRVVTHFVSEIAELDHTFKLADSGTLKAFITTPTDVYRLPYGREDQANARRTSMIATVNDIKFLVDETGNRRYWTVPINHIDLQALHKLDAAMVWRQVWAQYAAINPDGFRLTDAELQALEQRNSDHRSELPAESEIRDILERDDVVMQPMTVSDFMQMWPTLKRYSAKSIGAALDKLGITAERTKRGRYRTLPVPR